MHSLFITSLLAIAPAVTSAANLVPWEISAVSTFSPSSYPASHPYSQIWFTITNPNHFVLGSTRFGDATLPASATNCSVYWQPHSEKPDGWTNTCERPAGAMIGKWTFEVLPGNFGYGTTRDFSLRITLSQAVVLGNGAIISHKYVGQKSFLVGDNLAGACGGSGVCSYGLAEKVQRPVLVEQGLLEAKCITGACEEGLARKE
ncbi:hypothetical protein QBC35DRAFT_255917 [Podospora australis]|uniref:Ubiquitin 3 binding protein But2 C-terminal domain-containing protein n=1 Tax=Podospora australis TaxID=1536484 RepID=A0AAN7AHZ2_9PEZI|nr:hypothetical protein QBC35DRAFT_255917 [Podospora australis]